MAHIPSITRFLIETLTGCIIGNLATFTNSTNVVQKGLDLKMIDSHCSIIGNINKVIGMQTILPIYVDAMMAITQRKDDTRYQAFSRFGRYNRMQAVR